MKQLLLCALFSGLSFLPSMAQEEEKDWREEAREQFEAAETMMHKAFLIAKKSLQDDDDFSDERINRLVAAQDAWLKWSKLEAEFLAYEESYGGPIHEAAVSGALIGLTKRRTAQLLGKDITNELSVENFADIIGDALADSNWSTYTGQLDPQLSPGVLALEWMLKNKQVRGFFYSEANGEEHRLYGYNDVDGQIRMQLYKNKQLVCSGILAKHSVNGKLTWSGNLTSPQTNFSASFTKIPSLPAKTKSKTRYAVLKGFNNAHTLGVEWYTNDTLSGTAIGGAEVNEWTYFSGVNYRKGWILLEESGAFGDNESLIGARTLLKKQKINGVLVWQGIRYDNNGSVSTVAFGRKTR